MKDFYFILIGIAAGAIIGIIVGYFIGVAHRKKVAEAAIGSAEKEANKIVCEALATAEAKKKDLLLEAKEEALRVRNETERDLKERRGEISRTERRLNQKEENLDHKTEALERKSEKLMHAMTGAALTMQLVCAEVNGAVEKAETLALETVKQFPEYKETAKKVFPDLADKFGETSEE